MSEGFKYGGQAVIEGVMIRGQRNVSVAVRRPNGQIVGRVKPLAALYTGRLRRIPFVRGVIVLVETLTLAIWALMFSTNVALEEEGKAMTPGAMWSVVVLSLLLIIGVFWVTPLLITGFLDRHITSSLLSNVAEGLIRLLLFLGYLKAINVLADIRRVFAYHGAEHKTINAYEQGARMEVGSIKNYNKQHPRCGTAFLLVVIVLAIGVFALLGRPDMWLRIVSRIVLLPFIAALSYEVIRLGASHYENRLVRIILWPSLALQALTTREPKDSQIEVAISALNQALGADGEQPAMGPA